MGYLWEINSGVLAGVMIAVYELLLLPIVDFSLIKVCRLFNVRVMRTRGVGVISESPLPFSATPYVCINRWGSWIFYLIRLIPFFLVTVSGFLISSEKVTRTNVTRATVMAPGNGAFRFSSSESSVRNSASLEWFCIVGNDVFMKTKDGSCTSTKVLTDLGTRSETVSIGEEACDIEREMVNTEVGGTVGQVLVVGRCKQDRHFAYWSNADDSLQRSGTLFQVVERKVYVAQVLSEMYISESKLSGVYGSMKGVEAHFKGWDAQDFIRAVMTNVYAREMGVLKIVTAALLVPRENVEVQVLGDEVIMTRVSPAMIAVTVALGGTVLVFFVMGLASEGHRKKRYALNPLSSAGEVASLAAVGCNGGKIRRTMLVVKTLKDEENEIEQVLEEASEQE